MIVCNFQDLYGKPLNHNWMARYVFPGTNPFMFQRLLQSQRVKIDRLPDFNMLLQSLLKSSF